MHRAPLDTRLLSTSHPSSDPSHGVALTSSALPHLQDAHFVRLGRSCFLSLSFADATAQVQSMSVLTCAATQKTRVHVCGANLDQWRMEAKG